MRGVALGERVTAAAVNLWGVRLEDDRGAQLGSGPDDHQRLLPVADDWRPIAIAEEGFAGFNQRTLVQRFHAQVLEDLNRSAVPVQAQLVIPGSTMPALPIALPAHGSVSLNAPLAAVSAVVAREVRVDGVRLQSPALVIAHLPPNPLTFVPDQDDPLFNPLTIVYAVARQGSTQARLIIVKRSAIDLHCDWQLPAYQKGLANPRLDLAAGASTTLVVAVEHSDIRLPLA